LLWSERLKMTHVYPETNKCVNILVTMKYDNDVEIILKSTTKKLKSCDQ